MVIGALVHGVHALPAHDQQFISALALRMDAGQVTSLTQVQLDKLKQLYDRYGDKRPAGLVSTTADQSMAQRQAA